MDIILITYQMLALFLLLVAGYVAYKAHVTNDEAIRNLTTLVLNVSLPAQILISFLSNRGKVSNMTLLEVTGISLFCYIVYFLVAAIFIVVTKAPKKQWGTYIFMLLFGNVGFMGYPVIQAVFGIEAMIYAVVFNVMFNFIVYSLGIMLIGGEKAGKFEQQYFIRGTAVVLAATPVATNATMLAIQYDGDVQLVSKGIFFSTVLSVVTIPIVAIFL